uniref:Perivitellin-2 31 kDa subunit n=1 Tax=Pomacea maculata TaxID=1245466 RepID=PV22_POMMA|nr:RecName: Full=Perivitellin-2 31 kDa subunit; Short=PmPV2 31 kDa subunit; Short=PmPV2-31; AltName: Full=PV2 tachylectin 'B' delivery subunit; AltName: Full=Pma_3499_0.54; AltName: Full=Pore forming toxin; Short=PFT; Flags: Precursor [Pomacea maculata]
MVKKIHFVMERHASIVAFLLAVLALTESQAFTSVKLPRDEHWPYNYVSVGPAGVWAVNRQNKLFYRTGTYGDNANMGSGWQFKQDGVGQVDVGKDKVGYINLSGGSLFRIEGISQANPVGGTPKSWEWWTKYIGMSLREDTRFSSRIENQNKVLTFTFRTCFWASRITNWCFADSSYTETVTAGGSGTWITKSQLKYKSGTFGNPDTEGGDWILVDSGSFQHVSSGSGVVLAVRSNGELVQRTGITCSLPQGTGWTSMLNSMSRVDTYGTVAWAVDTAGDLYFINL